MRRIALVLGFLFWFHSGNKVHAGTVTYTDLNTFLEAAGNVNEIDFDTLPDGSPSVFRTEITPEFNYTDQGVDFFSHNPDLFISGNDSSGFNLTAAQLQSGGPRNWIIAELVEPASAVGILFGGITSLSIFTDDGIPIGGWNWGGGGDFFFGVISDEPIGTAIIDRGIEVEIIDSFFFTPVPEPATLLLLGTGALMLLRRRR